MTLKERNFVIVEDIIMNATDELFAIQQTSFKLCFQEWKVMGAVHGSSKEVDECN
jgi:hypothetical protein